MSPNSSRGADKFFKEIKVKNKPINITENDLRAPVKRESQDMRASFEVIKKDNSNTHGSQGEVK